MSNPILEAIGRCNPDEPLPPDDPRWQDFDKVRGTDLHWRISQRLQSATLSHTYSHIALIGHRGGGKTSEVNRIKAFAEKEGFLPIYTAVNQQADPNELTYGDLFLLMLRLLEKEFNSNPRLQPLSERATKNVTDWFSDVTNVKKQELERAISYTGEASLGITTPLLKMLSGLSALRKSTGKEREEVRAAVEKFPAQLRDQLNFLLDEAHQIARPAYPRGLFFILDNLDRYTPEMINDAIIKNSSLFKTVNAHTIFVMHISLVLRPAGEIVSDHFVPEMLPMVPVFRRGNPHVPDETVIDAVTEAIYKRVPPALFADPALAREAARLSGGSPRDLLRLLQEALLESREVIDKRALQRAASIVRANMTRLLTYDHFATLAKTYLDGKLNPDEAGNFLLYYRHALEYNGERWIGVHPLLWMRLNFRQPWRTKRRRGAALSVRSS